MGAEIVAGGGIGTIEGIDEDGRIRGGEGVVGDDNVAVVIMVGKVKKVLHHKMLSFGFRSRGELEILWCFHDAYALIISSCGVAIWRLIGEDSV